MVKYANLECGDPRDHIYALLAISSKNDLDVQIDYPKANSVSQAFVQVSIKILQSCGNLEPLESALRWDHSSDLTHPSWALHTLRSIDLEVDAIQNHKPHPQAKFTTTPRFYLDDKVLILRGRVVGTIAVSTPPTYYNQPVQLHREDEAHIKLVSQRVVNVLYVLASLELTVENICALARTTVDESAVLSRSECLVPGSTEFAIAFGLWVLLRGQVRWIEYQSTKQEVDNNQAINEAKHWIQQMAKLLLTTNQFERFSTADNLNEGGTEIYAAWNGRALFRGRCLCIADNNLIYNGTHGAKKGDSIAVFQGGHVLYILRPVDTRYRLIGTVFVQGLMNGELHEGLDPDEVDYDIELV